MKEIVERYYNDLSSPDKFGTRRNINKKIPKVELDEIPEITTEEIQKALNIEQQLKKMV